MRGMVAEMKSDAMPVIIAPKAHVLSAQEAAVQLVAEHGVGAVLAALRRDIMLAEWAKRQDDIQYWRDVHTAVLSNANVASWPMFSDPPVFATPEEGLRLNRLFGRIASRHTRDAVVTFAEELVRNQPID